MARFRTLIVVEDVLGTEICVFIPAWGNTKVWIDVPDGFPIKKVQELGRYRDYPVYRCFARVELEASVADELQPSDWEFPESIFKER